MDPSQHGFIGLELTKSQRHVLFTGFGILETMHGKHPPRGWQFGGGDKFNRHELTLTTALIP